MPVTIPESLAVEETKRMIHTLKNKEMNINRLIVNQVMPENLVCTFCQAKHKLQQVYIKQLENSLAGIKLIKITAFPKEIKGIENLKELIPFISWR